MDVVGVFFCGADGVVTQANRCFLEMVGREPADISGRRITIQSLMTPTAQAIHAARLREIREHGALPPLSGELVHSNGTRVPVLLAYAVVESAAGESVTFAVDETATRTAADELRNELISISGDGTEPAVDASVFAAGEWQGELHQRTRSGAQIVVDSRCSLIPSAFGEPPMMLIINTDITERKSLERQLLHAQRLETLGALAGGIAHDLNNILMPIVIRRSKESRAAPAAARM